MDKSLFKHLILFHPNLGNGIPLDLKNFPKLGGVSPDKCFVKAEFNNETNMIKIETLYFFKNDLAIAHMKYKDVNEHMKTFIKKNISILAKEFHKLINGEYEEK